MNQLDKSLQGPEENVLTSSDKTFGFKRNKSLEKIMLQQETLKCFPIPLGSESEKDCQQFSSLTEIHLEELQNKTATFLAKGWGAEGGAGGGEGGAFSASCSV